jgi:hypothetical protein
MNEVTFDRNMRAIAEHASYPQTPAMRARVVTALGAAERRPAVRPTPSFAFAAAAVLGVILVGIAASLAVPSSRDAVADFFGIEGSEIEFVPSKTPLPPPQDIAGKAQLVTVDEATDAAGFDLKLSSSMGEPSATYLVRYGTQTVVVSRYDEFDLWQARLDSDANFGKGAPAGVTITDTFVGGMPARWVSGGPYFVQFNNADGTVVRGSERTVDANTLIWNDGETFFRIETDRTLQETQTIAESLQ